MTGMVPTMLETVPDDTDFDVDVRLQPVSRPDVAPGTQDCDDIPLTQISCGCGE
jgi:hypothetical protein